MAAYAGALRQFDASRQHADELCRRAEADGSRAGLRDAALFAVMSDALLRRSEAAALTVSDIERAEDGSSRVLITRSKTDQTGEGRSLYLGASTMRRMAAWLSAIGIQDGPLFRRVAKGPAGKGGTEALNARSMGRILRARTEAAGLEGRFTSHSPRVGSAQSLVRHGATMAEAQRDAR